MKKNLVLTLLVAFSTWSLKAQEVFSPYEEADSQFVRTTAAHKYALRTRLVRINFDLLDYAYRNVLEGGVSEFVLNLFPDESFPVVVNAINEHPSWEGSIYLRSADRNFTYSPPQRNEQKPLFLSFERPHEFAYYLVVQARNGAAWILKLPWGSHISPYRGDLEPDGSQISGKRYRLIHVNHDKIFSKVKNFQEGKEESIYFSLLDDVIVGATIESAIPSQDSSEDYKVTLDIPRGGQATEDNIFDLNIVDGEVASMEITYNFTESRNHYRVIPFDKVEGVYLMTEEMVERF